MSDVKLILGSSSRYRRELLDRLGVPFDCVSPSIDETPLAGESPAQLSQRLARTKARAVAANHPGCVVIGSDQVCDLEGKCLGKPHTRERAIAQLTAMSGKKLVFHTAVCVIDAAGHEQEVLSDTTLTMRPLALETITDYVDREQPFDCAGSAKIEKLGIALMQSVSSDDPTSLIGLPLMALTSMLSRAGVSVLKGL